MGVLSEVLDDPHPVRTPRCPTPSRMPKRRPLAFGDFQASRGRHEEGTDYDSMTGTVMEGYIGFLGRTEERNPTLP